MKEICKQSGCNDCKKQNNPIVKRRIVKQSCGPIIRKLARNGGLKYEEISATNSKRKGCYSFMEDYVALVETSSKNGHSNITYPLKVNLVLIVYLLIFLNPFY